MSEDENRYELEQIENKLIGGTIVEAISDSQGVSFGFEVRHQNTNVTYLVWVDRDEEGNGAGHLDIKEKG
jgi:hypothetical protein